MTDDDRYLFISTDSHAAPATQRYGAYLDPAFRADLETFLGRSDIDSAGARGGDADGFDADPRRNELQEAQGIVGEVIFPDGIPPFYPDRLIITGAPRPREYRRRRAGLHAVNRWMADFCAAYPQRRAGVGAVLLNETDETVADIEWIVESGLRGGVWLPNLTPDADWLPHLGHRRYDPVWEACQALEVPVNLHVQAGFPPQGTDATSWVLFNTDISHYAVRNVGLMILAGVFDRFPDLRVVLSEVPLGVLTGLLEFIDLPYRAERDRQVVGTVPILPDMRLDRLPSEYLATNVWITASPALVADLARVERYFGFDRLMIGNDYHHTEGAYPFTREVLRQMFHDRDPALVRTVLGETPTMLYRFDPEALAPIAAQHGPSVQELAEPLRVLPDHPNWNLVVNRFTEAARPTAREAGSRITRDASEPKLPHSCGIDFIGATYPTPEVAAGWPTSLDLFLASTPEGSSQWRALARLAESIRDHLGADETVWGVKASDRGISWELYLYPRGGPIEDRFRRFVVGCVGAGRWRAPTWLPSGATLVSVEFTVDDLGGIDFADSIAVHQSIGGAADEIGVAYAFAHGSRRFKNTYQFFATGDANHAWQDRLCRNRLVTIEHVDAVRGWWRDVVAASGATTVWVGSKTDSDGVYLGRCSSEALVSLIGKGDYPTWLHEWVTDNAELLGHLRYDLGYDWVAESGEVRIVRSAFHGWF